MDNMSNKNQGGSTRGRPRSPNVTEAVHATALALVAEAGLASITRSEIATRAGVSRQTLYNRWDTVGDIVLEALLVLGEREIGPSADTDEMPGPVALRVYIAGLAAALNDWAAPGLKAVTALAQQDAVFAERFREHFLAPRHRRLLAVVAAHCRQPQEAALLAELVAGSMWYRLLVSGQLLDDAWVDAMVALVER